MTVGKRLKEERLRLGFSQDAFGAAGGVGKGAQINYEKDDRDPDAKYLIGINDVGADVLYVLIGKRRIDLAATEHERALLTQAIEYVMSTRPGDIAELGVAIQSEYDRRYANTDGRGLHPGQALTERDQALIASFHQANEEGRKVIERIAQLEAARAPKKSSKGDPIHIKGHGNAVGSNIKMGSVIVGDTKTKKR